MHTSAGTPGQYRICSVHVPPVYVQFIYLRASGRRHFAGGIDYTAGTAGTGIGTGTGADFRTGTGRFGKFGTSIPVPETLSRSVRHQYRHRKLRCVRYDINTGTGHFGTFGTLSIPVPDTSVSSVRHPYRYREYRYRTEHTLEKYTPAVRSKFWSKLFFASCVLLVSTTEGATITFTNEHSGLRLLS